MARIQSRFILMDLNVALSANFGDMKNHGFEDFVKNHETYRQWMVDLLRPEYVVLVTARNIKWAMPTLRRIYEMTGWIPNDAMFNDTGIEGSNAPLIKQTQLERRIYPRYGDNPKQYYAIDSNTNTREMYRRMGIQAFDCERNGAWLTLPF